MLHTRNQIDCVNLKDLYIKRKFSLLKIGKTLGFSSRTIEIKAKECKIALRNPGTIPPTITDKTLKHLYLKKRMSSRKIAKIYKCSYSYIDTRIKMLNILRRDLASAHIVTKRASFSSNRYEKAYLIGFRIGDLRARKIYKNSETILIDCGSTKPNQILLIKNLFKKYGRVWISKPKTNGKTQIEISVNQSFSFLLPKYPLFPNWTMKNRRIFLNILAGFIDAEGSFFVSNDKSATAFSLGNYNKPILKQIDGMLKEEDFNTRIFKGVKKGYTGKDGYSHSQDYWMLTINRKSDVYRFANLMIPFLKHQDRIRDAKKAIENVNHRNKKFGFKGKGMINFTHGR
jgi:LAGLIDADG-like domain